MAITVQSGRDGQGNSVSKPVVTGAVNPARNDVDDVNKRVDYSCDSWPGQLCVFVELANGESENYVLQHRVGGPVDTITIGGLTISGRFTQVRRDHGTKAAVRAARNAIRQANEQASSMNPTQRAAHNAELRAARGQ